MLHSKCLYSKLLSLAMPLVEFKGKKPMVDESAYIPESVVVLGDVRIGPECVIYPGAVIRGDTGSVIIERGCVIQDGALINTAITPVRIGRDSLIGFNSLIHGASIGARCVIGAGAIIMPAVQIGDESIVGAASFVPMGARFEPRSLIAGIPAQLKRQVEDRDLRMWQGGLKTWRDLGLSYKKQGLKL